MTTTRSSTATTTVTLRGGKIPLTMSCDFIALGQIGLHAFHMATCSLQFRLQRLGRIGRALVVAPHAPARRHKLANDLCAQAVSASGDQNLFHEGGLGRWDCAGTSEVTKG